MATPLTTIVLLKSTWPLIRLSPYPPKILKTSSFTFQSLGTISVEPPKMETISISAFAVGQLGLGQVDIGPAEDGDDLPSTECQWN